MTRDEILKVLDESDLRDEDGFRVLLLPKMYLNDVISFAELIAAHEREECAKVCEAQQNMAVMRHPARIEVEYSTQNMMALKCAVAIRARGQ
jgi:hypothetical protein